MMRDENPRAITSCAAPGMNLIISDSGAFSYRTDSSFATNATFQVVLSGTGQLDKMLSGESKHTIKCRNEGSQAIELKGEGGRCA